MREISNLDLKIQLTNEYLRTGGVEKIYDVDLLQDLINVKFDINGKANPETITPRLNAFMLAILHSHTLPPVQIDNHISEYASFVQKSLFFDQNKIETKEQVDELFEKYKQTDTILFRGQREAKWRLYSTIQRWWIWDKIEEVHFIWLDLTEDNVGFETTAGQILVEIETDVPSDVYLTEQKNYWLSSNHGIKKITNSVEPRSSTSGHSIQVLTINNLHQIEIQPLNGESTISIYDAYGRRLSTKRIDLSTHNIDADLPIGIYILSIEDKIGIQSQKVFISK